MHAAAAAFGLRMQGAAPPAAGDEGAVILYPENARTWAMWQQVQWHLGDFGPQRIDYPGTIALLTHAYGYRTQGGPGDALLAPLLRTIRVMECAALEVFADEREREQRRRQRGLH